MNKTLFSGVFSAKGRMFLGTLVAMAWIIIGCSDTGKNSDEINIREERANSVGKTNDDNDVLVFQEDELDNVLFKIDTTTASDTGFVGKLLFRDLGEEKVPQVGDIIASGQTTIAEYGFLYKVRGVSTENGVTTIEVRSASLEEAIEDVDFESETELQFDESGNLLRTLQKSANDGGLRASIKIPLKKTITDNSKIEGEITASVAYSMKLNFNISIKKWKLQTTKMSVTQSGNVTLKGAVNASVERSELYPIVEAPLPPITFFVGLVPVVITNNVFVDLKVSGRAEAGISVEYTLSGSGEYGIEYRDGRIQRVNNNNFNTTFNYEQHISGFVRIGTIVGLDMKLYGFAGLSLGAGPAAELYVGGNLAGIHVFDNGFRNDYIGYSSIWNLPSLQELGADAIKNAITNSGKTAGKNFTRTIANEARLDYGLEYSARVTLGVLGVTLLKYEFAEDFIPIGNLYRTSFLPLFDDLQITAVGSSIEVSSQIERDFLNYPVKSYGICVEIPFSNECRNGQGIRWVDNVNVPLRAGSRRNFTATFNNLEPGKTYAIRPYFSTGIGTYYDKATSFTPYTLTINRNPTAGGTATYSPEQESYSHGTQVTVIATANPGYEFTSWSGALTSTNAAERITINSNKTLTANFQQRIYTLTTVEAPVIGGSIIRTPNKPSYNAGETVIVTANPKEGFTFAGWSGALTSKSSNIESVIMDNDKSLFALFNSLSATDIRTLTISDPGIGGTVFVNGTASTGTTNHNYGAQITVKANAAQGYRFTGWTGTLTSPNATEVITMDNIHALTANFVRTYTLTVNRNPTAGGTVTGNGTFDMGTNVPITVTAATTPNPGYRFSHWSGDGIANQYSANTTVSMTADRTITANFVQRFTLTIDRNTTAGGTMTGAGTFDANTPVTITAFPASNYEFVNWTVTSGTAKFGNANSTTTTVTLNSNATIRANFARIITFDTTFNSSANYTFNKGFPATVEVYALGAGGGGQGGHYYFDWGDRNGTGASGGGGAATYIEFIIAEKIDLDIIVGSKGSGGGTSSDGLGFHNSGGTGGKGGDTKITWGYKILLAGGGSGGGGSGKNLSAGSGGSPSLNNYDGISDYYLSKGDDGIPGQQNGCKENKGGNAGSIPAYTGSLTTSFGGGLGGETKCSSSSATLYGTSTGAGGAGGGNGNSKGGDGGNGQVRIIAKYRGAL